MSALMFKSYCFDHTFPPHVSKNKIQHNNGDKCPIKKIMDRKHRERQAVPHPPFLSVVESSSDHLFSTHSCSSTYVNRKSGNPISIDDDRSFELAQSAAKIFITFCRWQLSYSSMLVSIRHMHLHHLFFFNGGKPCDTRPQKTKPSSDDVAYVPIQRTLVLTTQDCSNYRVITQASSIQYRTSVRRSGRPLAFCIALHCIALRCAAIFPLSTVGE